MATPITAKAANKLFLSNSLKPMEPYVNSQKPWKSRCLKCGKTVSPNYAKVKARGHQCGYCAGTKVDAADAIALVKENGFTPLKPYPGGNSKWLSICSVCSHQVEIRYSSVKAGFGCKYCTGKEIHPDDAKASILKRGYQPLSKYPGATKPWAVKCVVCRREQQVKMHSVSNVKRCIYCARRKLDLNEVAKRLSPKHEFI